MDWFNEMFDLAAVASGAGLVGGAGSTAAALAFSGTIVRFVMRTLMTAAFTGVGFMLLLNALGFQIVPPDDLRERLPFEQGQFGTESFTGPEGTAPTQTAVLPEGERVVIVRSPFRRD